MSLGATLILIGVGCIIAGIVGGGVKLHQLEVGSVKSVWRQGLLVAFGIILSAIGLGLNADSSKSGDGDGNRQASVNSEPAGNASTPDINESAPVPLGTTAVPETGGRISRTTLNIAGRWSVEGSVISFRQVGSVLFVTGPDGESGTGTLIGSEARWSMSGEGMGTIDCRTEVMDDQQVIAGSC